MYWRYRMSATEKAKKYDQLVKLLKQYFEAKSVREYFNTLELLKNEI